ncbi:TlpA family protein disulfide reductase [Fibrivirga algicola]|uniref:TlpA family protein disulfide reductase n=1 Tax=Fibrivirga algicola TaxID=2950420 RepID=A0ABX0QF68_9BACT|nr:TlpA disulfide reductase family protein [Fibrivirga algicola]NID11030.1 TlpA family protein disulfide reductase [Fibrivirga algicola]
MEQIFWLQRFREKKSLFFVQSEQPPLMSNLNCSLMKKILRYVLLLLICNVQVLQGLAADTLRVKTRLSFNPKNRIQISTVPTVKILHRPEYQGYPRCDTSSFTVIVLDRDQQFFGSYKDKRRTLAQFLEIQKQYGIDTTQLVPRRIKSYVSVFTGLKGPKKIIIVDANNNNDFSDDSAYEFDTLTMERNYRGDTTELAPLVRVNYERAMKQGIQQAHTYLRLLPYNEAYGYQNDMERRLAVYIQTQVYREGNFIVDGQEYKVSISPASWEQIDNYARPDLKIQLADQLYDANKEVRISIGKNMLAGNHLFTFLSSTKDGELTLVAERYDPNRVGGRVRNLAPVLVGRTDKNEELVISQLLKKGSYVLLDFWGSWCGPCIAGIPALKALHQQVKPDKIQFVGVDYEYNEAGRVQARKLEADKQLNWQQVIEYSSKQTDASIPRQLGVQVYPTYMLLSPEGRILMREVGETGLAAVKAKLSQLGLLTR